MLTLDLNKNKKYLLACSFGPDSMALAELLRQGKYQFSIAHVNYHLRDESNKECENLKQFCIENNIEIFILDVKENINKNIEEKCREIRYLFFQQNYQGFDALLVGHHQDDLLETYLLQKQRNILPSYYGLKKENDLFGMKVIRPLLDYQKTELRDFCIENHVPYSVDSSNLLDIYARNKIRHQIIEKMNQIQKEDLLQEIKKRNTELEKYQKECLKLNNLSNKEIVHLPFILFRLYLNKLVARLNSNFTVSYKVAIEIKKILLSNKPNIECRISKNINFIKEYETCYFDFVKSEENFNYILDKGVILDTPYFYLDFTKDTSNRNISSIDYPIQIRNAQSDDLYLINGYPVKVRRLFIDWKMPISLRKRWPVILNKDKQIIYIPRYQKDFVPDKLCNFYVK